MNLNKFTVLNSNVNWNILMISFYKLIMKLFPLVAMIKFCISLYPEDEKYINVLLINRFENIRYNYIHYILCLYLVRRQNYIPRTWGIRRIKNT